MGIKIKPIVIGMGLVLSGCMSTEKFDDTYQANLNVPSNWQQTSISSAIDSNWLAQLVDPQIHELVAQALENNYQLKSQAYAVAIKEQLLIASGAALWPSLDVSMRSTRNKANQPVNYSNNHSLNLNLSYELDIWGKLSDSERQANLEYLAQKANFEQAKHTLVADVVTAWFKIIEAKKLMQLYQGRVKNAQQNLTIIESGYQQGLSSALDVYLTRNEVNNERSRVANQQAELSQAKRVLERLVGQYPEGELAVKADLPLLLNEIPTGLPSQLMTRKPALIASWYQLLSKDAALAYAHKQRFPSINLTGSIGNSSNEINQLLSPSSLAWSLIGGISAPLFNGGRLAANEERVRLEREQSEQTYLNTLFDAFSSVENALTAGQSLQQRYLTMLAAQENALAAETLSFEQYQSGLVEYTTVLESQKRAFDAQSSVIQIKTQLITNRINLHLALGGDFSSTTTAIQAD
ncbi:efflux transporter outer membrane subunit [Pseudoalteromonas ulvae]|uniref:RND transporter n=1 Tax=Pseudoalteromonas ulvae TaxID=107327 RepID=A0A244CVD9_PSEDV|nr:efflux transporter outer membrane subunit [Pseudoalteromonas ulvae]OUL59219.1 RND transporter [Pseudoalteromonas ulvae]